ncbi:MAG: phosphoribosyltransferase [Bacteroidota bacterium]
MTSVEQIFLGCIVAFISFIIGLAYRHLLAKWRVFRRRQRAIYPRELASTERIDLSEFLDAMRVAGTRVRMWNENAPIIGLNRGGAIVAGFISKHLDRNHIGLVNFTGDEPELVLPKALQNLPSPTQVVLVDDQYNRGDTAREGIRLLKEHYGEDVRIFLIALTSKSLHIGDHDNDLAGTSTATVNGTIATLFLFIPKSFSASKKFKLPWDVPDYREGLGG